MLEETKSFPCDGASDDVRVSSEVTAAQPWQKFLCGETRLAAVHVVTYAVH